jgi:predicted ribosome quality control (RQC) complex YloA/Tae2 family protein
LGCAHNIGAEKSREREMAGGLPYVYPVGHQKVWYCAKPSLSEREGSINTVIDDYYAQCIYEDKFKRLKDTYSQIISKKLKKDENSLKKIQGSVDKNCDKYRLFGDLIMANLYQNKDYSENITVFDYENNKETTIELDETKTLKENANKFYKLYNKTKTTKAKVEELTSMLNANIEYYGQILYSLELARNVEDLNEIKPEIEPEKVIKTQKKSALEPLELEIEGAKVFVGRNNRQNDFIVSKLSKDEDYWFHTKDCAGSHVLLKAENPSDSLILACAKLAKDYSKGSKSSKVGVIYTQRKYLKKPPKANLGYVTYKYEKEIIL